MAIIHTQVQKQNQAELNMEKIRIENKQLRDELRMVKQQTSPTEGAHLVVNGQVRKIGKKSQYLLDMLTLPEDK